MRTINRLIITIMCTVVCFNAQAASTHQPNFPAGCRAKNIKFDGNNLILATRGKPEQQYLFLIQNKSSNPVWLDHPAEKAGKMNAGWASELTNNNWSAIAINKKDFMMTCVEMQPGAEQFVACEETLSVCELTTARFNKKNRGTYWIAENKSRDRLADAITKRDIKIRRQTL